MGKKIPLFPYKMKGFAQKGPQWFRADDLAESEIAVIVDSETSIIWFWEGQKSSAKDRSSAREILGQLKKKYLKYKFKRVSTNSSDNILEKLEELREKSFKGKVPGIKYELKDFSRIFFILNIISSIIIVAAMIFLSQALLWTEEINAGYVHYTIDKEFFLSFIEINSFILILSLSLFIASALFGGIFNKGIFSITTLIAAGLVFMAFFMIRIWDINVFYEEIGNNLLIRKDVLILFILLLEILIMPGVALGFLTGIIGLKDIKIGEVIEEVNLKQLTLGQK